MIKGAGIYEIKNIANGKRYIGSTLSFNSRFRKHKTELRGGYHHSPKLQNAWNKHGEDSFVFSVLAVLEKDQNQLIETEQRLLDQINSSGEDSYNIAAIAGASMKGRKQSEEFKKKAAERMNGNTYTLGMKFPNTNPKTPEWVAKFKETLNNKSDEQREATRKKQSAAKIGKAPPNKGKHQSHCYRGHEYFGDNLYISPKGKFTCVECRKINEKNRKDTK
jgi:group I intron endonuclease